MNMFNKVLVALLGLFSMAVLAQDFEAGQVWKYKTRSGESDSRLYIVKVDAWPNGKRIFHIHVDKLKIKNPMVDGGIQTDLPHAPVSEEALRKSVRLLQKYSGALPDIAEGYAAWKDEYDKGGAGVFTISVSEIITAVEDAVNQHAKSQR